MRQIIIKCDICEKQKTETNHWILWQAKYDDYDNMAEIRFFPFSDIEAQKYSNGHLCSQGCATSKFQQYMEQTAQTNL